MAHNMVSQNGAYVQYGCGWSAPESWRNFDASPTLRFERLPLIGGLYTRNKERFPSNVEFGDITSGLPVPDGSCAGVYCSHVLEHLSLEDCRKALVNTRDMLEAGGTFRLVLPDLRFHAQKYLDTSSESAAHEFMRETSLGCEKRDRGPFRYMISMLGNSKHLWMWDYESLHGELRDAGFVEIRRAEFGDSADSRFAEVEQADRWQNCLGIECQAPL